MYEQKEGCLSLLGCVKSPSPIPPVGALLAAAACWCLVGIAMLFLLFNVAVSVQRWMERSDHETQVKTLRPPDHLRPGRLAVCGQKRRHFTSIQNHRSGQDFSRGSCSNSLELLRALPRFPKVMPVNSDGRRNHEDFYGCNLLALNW